MMREMEQKIRDEEMKRREDVRAEALKLLEQVIQVLYITIVFTLSSVPVIELLMEFSHT